MSLRMGPSPESSNNGIGLISTSRHWLFPKFRRSTASLAVRLEPAWTYFALLGCLHHDIDSFKVGPQRGECDFV